VLSPKRRGRERNHGGGSRGRGNGKLKRSNLAHAGVCTNGGKTRKVGGWGLQVQGEEIEKTRKG